MSSKTEGNLPAISAGYSLAIIASIFALLLSLVIDDPRVEPNTQLLFIGAVFVASRFGGIGPGLLATLLNGLSIAFFYIHPSYSFKISEGIGVLRFVEFLAVSLVIVVLNDSLRKANEEAKRANRAKDVFFSMVSHELRQPLSAIRGWANILQSGKADHEINVRGLEIIERNAKLQQHLINDLLDASRILSGKLHVERKPIDIAVAVEVAIDAARPDAEIKQVRLVSKIDTVACRVAGDVNRLQQVVGNLLSNAIKFTPEGGIIEIAVEHDRSSSYIRVKDSGEGLDSDALSRIFEPFFQTDSSGKKKGGLGLGLAIARDIVRLHDGTLTAESEGRGLGATFIVELPLLTDHSAGSGQRVEEVSVSGRVTVPPSTMSSRGSSLGPSN